jgi:hypothetical protein
VLAGGLARDARNGEPLHEKVGQLDFGTAPIGKGFKNRIPRNFPADFFWERSSELLFRAFQGGERRVVGAAAAPFSQKSFSRIFRQVHV